MKNTIAIRKENIDLTEKRSPLSPQHVKKLIKEYSLKVLLEPWSQRIFNDHEFQKSGAILTTQIDPANIIFGVKEIPVAELQEGKACVFFSHTIKGQPQNMPLLKSVLGKNISLLDYEKVTDISGKRLIFFGPYAGLAGAINAIWLLGKRLDFEGIKNPFNKIRQARDYISLSEAKQAFKKLARDIYKNGLPKTGKPLVIVITGNGTVSKGAQEIIDLLPVTETEPAEIPALFKTNYNSNIIYKVVIDCDNFVKPVNPADKFDMQDYFNNPYKYEADFKKYLPFITVLINGIFWDRMYPRLVTKDDLKELYDKETQPALRIIADITCDVEGSVECNLKSTTSENPSYVYNPFEKSIKDGIEGTGPVILAVDKLPSELPAEATQFFGDALLPFIAELARADFSQPFDKLSIPAEFKRALITHRGKLTPSFEYLNEFL